MGKSAAVRNFVVGLVFLGSLFVVGVVTLQVSGLSLGEPTRRIAIRFDKVSGLRTGDEVRIYGYRVGQVEEIEPVFFEPGQEGIPARPLRVEVRVPRDLPLGEGTRFLVKSAGPLGGNYVEIIPRRPGDRAPSAGSAPPGNRGPAGPTEEEYEGTATSEVFDELGELVRENRQTIQEAIREIRDAVRAINEREGALGALIRDPQLRDRLSSAVTNIESITRDISEGKGTVGKLIKEDQLHEDLKDLVARARSVVQEVEEGKGTLGVLLKDETLARELSEGVKELREVAAKVNQGEGTVGQLVNNREAWDRLVFVLRQIQEAVEDFREQAPINTFVNTVFSAF